MPGSRKFIVDHAIAQRLADLAGIEHDLTIVMRTCDLFLRSPSVGAEDALVGSNAIAAFAIITYFRTLSSGVRGGVTSAQIDSLPRSLREAHLRLRNVRDRYLAHSVNQQEANIVTVSLNDDGPTISSVGTEHSRPATFSNSDVILLRSLAEAVKSIVDRERSRELDSVWDFVAGLTNSERESVLREYMAPGLYWDWNRTRRRLGQ